LRTASDEDLAWVAATGSERAFEAFYDRHRRGVLRFCRRRLGSPEEAEDALQQVFMAVYASLVRSGPPEAPAPWLYAIAQNRCSSVLRARHELVTADPPEGAGDDLATGVERRIEAQAVLADVARLRDEQRSALVLGALEDRSYEEIARIIGCRPSQVKGYVFQARSSLAIDRLARDTPCAEVRAQLSESRRGRQPAWLRRHLDTCPGCCEFLAQLRAQRRRLRGVLPLVPVEGLRRGLLGSALGGGAAPIATTVGGLAVTAVVALGVPAAGRAIADDVPRPERAVTRMAPNGSWEPPRGLPGPGGAASAGDAESGGRRERPRSPVSETDRPNSPTATRAVPATEPETHRDDRRGAAPTRRRHPATAISGPPRHLPATRRAS
jgi:RNA polymerase sigma factor (sigma-70 family)